MLLHFPKIAWVTIYAYNPRLDKLYSLMAVVAGEKVENVSILRTELARLAASFPSHPAIFGVKENLRIDYTALEILVQSCSQELVATFGTKCRRLAIVLPNGATFVVCFLAITGSKFVAVPLNPALTEEEFKFYLRDLSAQAVLTDDGPREGLLAAANQLGVQVYSVCLTMDGTFLKLINQNISKIDSIVECDLPVDVVLLLHTSGTTSRPKIVPISISALIWSAKCLCKAYKLTSEDQSAIFMPFFHIHGIVGCLLSTLLSGGTMFIPEKFSATRFLELIDCQKITWFSVVPTIFQILFELPEYLEDVGRLKRVQSRLRFVRSCSAPLSVDLRRLLGETFKVPILQAYGMTEAAHLVSTQTTYRMGPEASVGHPSDCKVVILDGESPCKAGFAGEICIQSPAVIQNYYGNESFNTSAFSSDKRYFRTGDLGFIDDRGYLTICGRIKEIINRAGEKINPMEVESSIMRCNVVKEVAVFSLPDQIYGEKVACAVVLSARLEIENAEKELEDYCLQNIAGFKRPSKFFFVETIPKSSIGKVQRIALSKQFNDK